MNRRKLLRNLAAASAPLVLPSAVLGKDAPSKRITLGFIGMGQQGGSYNLGHFMNEDDAVVLAVCDCDIDRAKNSQAKVNKARGNQDCAAYQDFREVLERDDIDAVVISTPDHWHVPMSMMALDAGKDVFCEKPTLFITEGRDLVRKVKQRQAVLQWGIEDRSMIKYHRLAAWARSGLIGELNQVTCVLPTRAPFTKEPATAVPAGLDWNLWLGPAPVAPYTASVIEPTRWRVNSDYSGGMLTDWGSHLCDTAQVGLGTDELGPVEVTGKAADLERGQFYSDVPREFEVCYQYNNGTRMIVSDGDEVEIRFVGSKGWVSCRGWNGQWHASDRKIFRIRDFGPDVIWPRPPGEHRDFLDAVRSRRDPTYSAEVGHRLSTTLHLGHLAIRSDRKVAWNPVEESFVGDKEALTKSEIYQRSARDWTKGL